MLPSVRRARKWGPKPLDTWSLVVAVATGVLAALATALVGNWAQMRRERSHWADTRGFELRYDLFRRAVQALADYHNEWRDNELAGRRWGALRVSPATVARIDALADEVEVFFPEEASGAFRAVVACTPSAADFASRFTAAQIAFQEAASSELRLAAHARTWRTHDLEPAWKSTRRGLARLTLAVRVREKITGALV